MYIGIYEWEMDAKLEPQSIKIMKNEVPKTRRKKRHTSRGSAGRARAPFLDSNFSSSSLKHFLNVLTSIRFACWPRFATHIVRSHLWMWILVRKRRESTSGRRKVWKKRIMPKTLVSMPKMRLNMPSLAGMDLPPVRSHRPPAFFTSRISAVTMMVVKDTQVTTVSTGYQWC